MIKTTNVLQTKFMFLTWV